MRSDVQSAECIVMFLDVRLQAIEGHQVIVSVVSRLWSTSRPAARCAWA